MARGNKREAPPPRQRPPERKIVLQREFVQDLRYWTGTDRKVADKLSRLVEEIADEPFGGIAKPELLKHDFAGCWSRRLTSEDRVIYKVTDDSVLFLSARGHYDDR